MELEAGNLLAVTAAWVGAGLLAATAALAAGAVTGRRVWGGLLRVWVTPDLW